MVIDPQGMSSAIDLYLKRRFEEENELMKKHRIDREGTGIEKKQE